MRLWMVIQGLTFFVLTSQAQPPSRGREQRASAPAQKAARVIVTEEEDLEIVEPVLSASRKFGGITEDEEIRLSSIEALSKTFDLKIAILESDPRPADHLTSLKKLSQIAYALETVAELARNRANKRALWETFRPSLAAETFLSSQWPGFSQMSEELKAKVYAQNAAWDYVFDAVVNKE